MGDSQTDSTSPPSLALLTHLVAALPLSPSPPCPFILSQAGFIVDDVWLVPRPTILPAGTGMRGWLSTFTQAFLNAIPEDSSSSFSGREKETTR